VVNDPEDPAGRPVRLRPHYLLDQPAERVDASLLLAPAKDSTAANVPSRQVLQGTASLVLMLDTHRSPGAGRQGCVASNAGLNAGLLIRTDDVVPAAQAAALPEAGIQVQDATRFLGELRVAREDPVLIAPRFDCVAIQDAPDSAGTDGPSQGRGSPLGQIGGRQATQRQLGLADGFTGYRFDNGPLARGKKRPCDLGLPDRPRRSHRMPSGVARAAPNSDATRPKLQLQRSRSKGIHGGAEQAEPSGAGRGTRLSDGQDAGIDQGTRRGKRAGIGARGQAWRDSIRGEHSVLRPNDRKISQATRHHNPTVNCE